MPHSVGDISLNLVGRTAHFYMVGFDELNRLLLSLLMPQDEM